MPTRKIADLPGRPCQHPEHNPPSMRVFEPGIYEHTCPKCGHVQTFFVREAVWGWSCPKGPGRRTMICRRSPYDFVR